MTSFMCQLYWSFIIFVVIQHLWNTCPLCEQFPRFYALVSCSKICIMDFVWIWYGKVIGMETHAFEEKSFNLHFVREGRMPCQVGSHGEAPVFVKRQKPEWGEEHDPETSLFSMGKGKAGQGKQFVIGYFK